MNTRRRVLAIARHFWPTITDDTLRLYHWLRQLQREGAEVTVLTPRWHSSWPRKIVCDEMQVHRIDHPPTQSLRLGRYALQLGQWVARTSSEYELIYFDAPEVEAVTVLSQITDLHPPWVVVRFDATRLDGGTSNSNRTPSQLLDICQRASLIWVQDVTAHQQLLAMGVYGDSIVRTAPLAGCALDRCLEARRGARQILSDVNHDLWVKSQDRVVVCPGELTCRWGVKFLISSLAPLVESYRSLRVWILGDGRERPEIYEALRDYGLHRMVAMPGIFTDPEQILQAADLCIFPAPTLGFGWLIPTCIVSSIPLLVSDSAAARNLLGPQAAELTFAVDQPKSLREKVAQWIQNPSALNANVSQVRQRAISAADNAFGCNALFQCAEARAVPTPSHPARWGRGIG